jgi:hypothetical protein
MHPNVYRSAIHLPNEHTTYFPEGTTVGEAMMRSNSTTLTRWCDFNQKAKSEYVATATLAHNINDPAPPLPAALTTLYPDYPEIAVWNKSKKVWHLRKRAAGRQGAGRNNHVTLGTMGRMYFVQPSEGERYYLRVLLTHVTGATCFKDLRITHPTRLPQLCTPLLKLPALHVPCYKMMLNGTSAFQKLLACNCPEACGSFLPAY